MLPLNDLIKSDFGYTQVGGMLLELGGGRGNSFIGNILNGTGSIHVKPRTPSLTS